MKLVERFARILKDGAFVDRHLAALKYKLGHRNATIATIPDWDQRRERARAAKAEVRARHGEYLETWIDQARAAGTTVHRAATAREANAIVLEIARRHEATSIVKSKSMTTEECGLNGFLGEHGIVVTDTDLGERIVQLFGEPPSHLVMPAIHRSRREVGELFAREGLCEEGEEDPELLTLAARLALRKLFLGAEIGITGGNFLVAETGSLVVIENEANSILGTSLTDCHIAVVGIEKLIPRLEDLATFLTVLAPSSTGQRLTTYATHYTGPQARTPEELEAGMANRELHVVLLDNGRSALRGTHAEEALACIRCGACLNACPVYRRVGGHAYESVYMGPIGEILSPALFGGARDELPKASSLCGACNSVCPVKIDIAGQIHSWRAELRAQRRLPSSLPPLLARFLARPKMWRGGIRAARRLGPISGFFARRSTALRRWQADGQRALPELPEQSFRAWWRSRRGDRASSPQLRLSPGSGPRRPARAHPDARAASREELEAFFREFVEHAGGQTAGPEGIAAMLAPGARATRAARATLAELGYEVAAAPIDKHELSQVQTLFATARVRVARKGSCWVDFRDLESRSQLLLAEELVLLVPRDRIVEYLDSFYAQHVISPAERVSQTEARGKPASGVVTAEIGACGTFVTGPSKTADIEQALVFGAHGPKKLLVVPC